MFLKWIEERGLEIPTKNIRGDCGGLGMDFQSQINAPMLNSGRVMKKLRSCRKRSSFSVMLRDRGVRHQDVCNSLSSISSPKKGEREREREHGKMLPTSGSKGRAGRGAHLVVCLEA